MRGVIDVHTHLACEEWLSILSKAGKPHFEIIHRNGHPLIMTHGRTFAPVLPGLMRFDGRLREMDESGTDICVLSLTAPGVTWGDREAADAASRVANEHLARSCDRVPDRFRWLASLPMHIPELALKHLRRADQQGAIGVIMLANVLGRSLTDLEFRPVWEELNSRKMVVLLHPTVPPGAAQMDMDDYHLLGILGLMFDTTLALTRMIFDGFLERYPAIKLIMPHSGATLPFLSSRLDHAHSMFPRCQEHAPEAPTKYFSRMYFDDANSSPASIQMCASLCGEERMLHGSDYPFVPLLKSIAAMRLLPDQFAGLARTNAERALPLA